MTGRPIVSYGSVEPDDADGSGTTPSHLSYLLAGTHGITIGWAAAPRSRVRWHAYLPQSSEAVDTCLSHSWFAPLRFAHVALREGPAVAARPASPRLAGDCLGLGQTKFFKEAVVLAQVLEHIRGYREQEWVCRSIPSLSIAPEALDAACSGWQNPLSR